jgi:hypothetical protein
MPRAETRPDAPATPEFRYSYRDLPEQKPMRRRTMLGGAGTALSAALAGCGSLADDEPDESSDGENESDESDGSNETDVEDDDDVDIEDGNEADDGDDGEQTDESDENEDDLHEDESITGEVLLSETAEESLSALRHTYTWNDDPPSDECQVHAELETVGDEAITVEMEARVYNEDGAELTSTRYADQQSPAPGETGVYSIALNNCEEAAAYELEIGDVDDDDDGEADESDEQESLTIDDFEGYSGGDLSQAWTVDGTGSADVSPDAAIHENSTQGLRQEGTSQIRSFPGGGLERYPEDGREVSILMRPDANTEQPWIFVNLDDDEWNTATDNWRLEIHMSSGIRIVRDAGDRTVLAEDYEYEFTAGDVYDCRFTLDSDDGVEFYVLDESEAVVAHASTSETTDIDDEMSLGLRTGQGVDWDLIRSIDQDD